MSQNLSWRVKSSTYSKNYNLISRKKQLIDTNPEKQSETRDSFNSQTRYSRASMPPSRSKFSYSRHQPILSMIEVKNKINEQFFPQKKISSLPQGKNPENPTSQKNQYFECQNFLREEPDSGTIEGFQKEKIKQAPLQRQKPQILIESIKKKNDKKHIRHIREVEFDEKKAKTHKKHRFMMNKKIAFGIQDKIDKIKQILYSHTEQKTLTSIRIHTPSFFYHQSNSYLSEQELLFKAVFYFEEMGYRQVKRTSINIFRYPKALIIAYSSRQKQICIIWSADGSVYCGGVKQNQREGMGIEWVPGKFIYFGEFSQNRRDGFGVMKDHEEYVYIGLWNSDHYHGLGKLFNCSGQLVQMGLYSQSRFVTVCNFRELF